MNQGLRRATRFAREWARPRAHLQVKEVEVPCHGGPLPTTVIRPREGGPGPGWVVLHGITRPGRRHPGLVRFARALAATGSTVVIPEIREWVALELAPHRARDATLAGLQALKEDPGVVGRSGLVGFSFGAPQALRVAMDPEVAPALGVVAAFGGYGELERTLRFLLTGRHAWKGTDYRVRPDPYGRWIVAANFLTRTPGWEDAGDVARALGELAGAAGDLQVEAWSPELDAVKDRVTAMVAAERRALFAYFAPPAHQEPPAADADAEEWALRLTRTARQSQPLLELPRDLEIPVPVFLIHGRNDHLIPFSETLRLAPRVRAPRVTTTVTGLFSHSAEDPRPRGPGGWGREAWRLGRTLARLLEAI